MKPVRFSRSAIAAATWVVGGLGLSGQVAAAAAAPPVPAKAATAPAVATTVSTAPATPDPMEQLRQRLAERLAGKAAKPAVAAEIESPVEVVLMPSRSPAAAAVTAPPGSRSTRAAGGASGAPGATATHGSSGHGGAGAASHWAYTGPGGPQTWGGLRPDFSLCAKGQRQSPIDIRGGLEVELEPVRFEYQSTPFAVIDNGHTVQANVAGGNRIEVGGRRFELQQLHFHRPSEERIDGRQFEMSLHLVHKDEKGRLAVVALLLDKGPALPAVQQVWNNLPLEKKEELRARTPLDLNSLLPADRRYYTYMGSLTTPPCSEGVQWIVMRQPVAVSEDQIELFARIYPMNARPLQQVAGRRILQSP